MKLSSDHQSLLTRRLKARRISCEFLDGPPELRDRLEGLIGEGSVVGIGDSKTLEDCGVFEFLRYGSYRFLDKFRPDIGAKEKRALYRDNFSADVFLSGVNALTLEGEIVNLDGNGSRAAPIIYGPDRVILVCGTNKIVPDRDAAIRRLKSEAAPQDARRLRKRTPCVATGECSDCRSADRICNYLTVVQGQFDENRIRVIVLQGEYGY